MKEKEMTLELAKEWLSYEPSTGVFTWRKTANKNGAMAGGVAGCQITSGSGKKYLLITLLKCRMRAHRLAWFYVYGEWPKITDHINGNGLDNRIDNLRDAGSIAENSKNTRLRPDNKSGRVGVYWYASRNKWKAEIGQKRRNICLGYYSRFEDAVAARERAELQYGFHENHGSARPL